MANDKFVIEDDLVIEVREPVPGSFVLNYSKLNSTDVLKSTKATSWRNLVCEAVNLSIDNRVTFNDSYYSPIAASGALQIRSLADNPDLNPLIYVGLPIRIKVRPRPQTQPLDYVTLFRGSILNASVEYEPGQSYPIINLNLTDNLDRVLNTQLDIDFPEQVTNQRTIRINGLLGDSGIETFRLYNFITDGTLLKARKGIFTVGELVNEILKLHRGGFAVNYDEAADQQWLELHSAELYNQPTYNFTLTNNAASSELELTYSQITSTLDNGYLFNQVVVEEEDGTVISSLSNISSINLHGVQSLNTTLPTNDTAYVTLWAEQVINDQRYNTFTDININGLDTSKRINKFITNICGLLYTEPPRPIRIIQDFYGVYSATTHPITRVSHNIDANSWQITLDTGKGVKSA